MDDLTFGVIMSVVGIGGTLVSLGMLSLLIALIKKIFPYREDAGKGAGND
jgi:hypothetical protein